ncbi:tetratricopeptide repeat protein [Bradyrhizobium sp.]|uniref:tetratricopeptide repeat protein n=1 Tax=Bradyrhizobium sp. TaxID=376 RepID=UPI003C33C7E2
MRRVLVAIVCCITLLARAGSALADPTSDRDMANRYLQAAQSGDDSAQFYLGALYSAGVGLARSDEEAFRWFSRAADQGHSHAMLILGGLYAIGRGVPRDYVSAYKCAYIVSAATKVEEFRNGSRQLMAVLEGKMTSEQVNQARTDALRWHAAATATPSQAPPAQTPAPYADKTRAAPLAHPPPAALKAPPAPAVPMAQSAIRPNSNSADPRNVPGKSLKKDDVDGLLDQVPPGLRKRFGF